MRWRIFLATLVVASVRIAQGFTIESVQAGGTAYTVAHVDPRSETLHLYLADESGKPFNRFDRLEHWLSANKITLLFAMNAGMYEKDYSPVGLFVADGKEIAPLNTKSGKGNFFLQPNGVFFVDSYGAGIVATADYAKTPRQPRLATQSGPLLVHGGQINGLFDAQSTSLHVRNGVGITASGEVVFAISEQPVNFFDFAALFRDALHCSEALYFDGTVSSLFAPSLQRNDHRYPLGPIIGITQ